MWPAARAPPPPPAILLPGALEVGGEGSAAGGGGGHVAWLPTEQGGPHAFGSSNDRELHTFGSNVEQVEEDPEEASRPAAIRALHTSMRESIRSMGNVSSLNSFKSRAGGDDDSAILNVSVCCVRVRVQRPKP